MKMGAEMNKAMREKYWAELTDGEKIDRMRQMLNGLIGEVSFLRSHIKTLEKHVHVGEHIYTKGAGFSGGSGEMNPRTVKDDKVFF